MNQYDFGGRVAVVTGGAQGIGAAVVDRLLGGGAKVAVWDLSAPQSGGGATDGDDQREWVGVDVADPASVRAAVRQTSARWGRIDILVNSAGIAGGNFPVVDYPDDEWKRIVDIDLNGTFYVCKAVLPDMIRNNYGRIVNISSIAGKEGNPNAAAYSAAKAGVIAMTKSLGKEVAKYDISVNAVTPAAAKTRIFDQMSKEHIAYMLSKIPRNRFAETGEIASMIAWLVSDENSFTTGAVFDLSGGRATY